MKKRCLGDGVYVAEDAERLVLTTENGIGIQNTIVLEIEVVSALLTYLEQSAEELRKERKEYEH